MTQNNAAEIVAQAMIKDPPVDPIIDDGWLWQWMRDGRYLAGDIESETPIGDTLQRK